MKNKTKITATKRFIYKLKKGMTVKRAIIVFSFILSFVFTSFVSLSNYATAKEYNRQAAEIVAECDEMKKEIEKKNEIINGDMYDFYCEKIAREQYGYVKPGEKIIYEIPH